MTLYYVDEKAKTCRPDESVCGQEDDESSEALEMVVLLALQR